MKKAYRGAARGRLVFNELPACNHGDHVFVQRRRKDGTLYSIPMVVNTCGAPASVTFTRDGNIQRRCTSHLGQ